MKSQFDVIGISETREQSNGILSNVNMNGYILHSRHSNSSSGGVALYVKFNLDHFIREDLSVLEDEFETLWVEIKMLRIKIFSVAVLIGIQILTLRNSMAILML